MTQGLEPTANAVPPFYRRLPDTCWHGTQAMRDLGAHENMAMKCEEVGALNLG